jgi:RNA polymerase sigma-70 factor (ECF subfamily)
VLDNDQQDDRELLLLLASGDEGSFNTIYFKYSPRLLPMLNKMLKSSELAEEVLQDVFITLWDNRSKICPDKCFRSYILCIAANKCYDYFRKVARDRKLYLTISQAQSRASDSDQVVIDREKIGHLYQIIELLPKKRRAIFRLCKVDGKSYIEVSKQLGISLSTISDHIVKANLFIRSHFSYTS